MYQRSDGLGICPASAFRDGLDTPWPWCCCLEAGHSGDHVATDREELSSEPLKGLEYHRWPHEQWLSYQKKDVH